MSGFSECGDASKLVPFVWPEGYRERLKQWIAEEEDAARTARVRKGAQGAAAGEGSRSMSSKIDLGHGHTLTFACWSPDRELNPQYEGLPDVERYSALIEHTAPDGTPCAGAVTFAGEVQARIEPNRPVWSVQSWEPLTLSPSVLCRRCGDHGFIREGKWVPA